MPAVLLAATEFCRLIDIDVKRFEQRRLRQRAVGDVAASLGPDADFVQLPIAPTEPGKHARFDALDAIRMRCVMVLESGGLSFNEACKFILSSGISAYLLHDGNRDFVAGRWIEPGGKVRHVSGTIRDLARAMPASPLMAVQINVSGIADDIVRRADAQLGLVVRHGAFFQKDDTK
ncbi:hypothetical protein N8D56_19760 [Devosia sp. A8/3-2]|nr:hypothetical protein N8D56_19760 [Devosia sp. A8/3-2]